MVTQASSVMMTSPFPTNGAQNLHENLLCIGDAAFPGLSNQNELNWTSFDLWCLHKKSSVVLMPHLYFRITECQESFLWIELGYQLASTWDKIGSSACPTASNWMSTSSWYWASQGRGIWLMATK